MSVEGDDVVGLLERDRRRLDILSVKKEAKLSAREIAAAYSRSLSRRQLFGR